MRALTNALCAALALGGATAIGLPVADPDQAKTAQTAPEAATGREGFVGPRIPPALLVRRAVDRTAFGLAAERRALAKARRRALAEIGGEIETASIPTGGLRLDLAVSLPPERFGEVFSIY